MEGLVKAESTDKRPPHVIPPLGHCSDGLTPSLRLLRCTVGKGHLTLGLAAGNRSDDGAF